MSPLIRDQDSYRMTETTFDDERSVRSAAGNAASEEINSLAKQSRLERLENQVHELSWSDIQDANSMIGVGAFSRVYKIQLSLPQLDSESFALKCLNSNTMSNQESFLTGAIDLAVEGEILSRIHHENIIQLHGVSTGGPLKAYTTSEKGYFLVLDLLEDTLKNKLDKHRSKKGSKPSRAKDTGSLSARLQTVALGVAKGLEYLHQNNIVLRDLKPQNIGFDCHGTPKIFDLGFARELHTIEESEIAGSLRYMAPEVALRKGALLASDVYSFGVLLWEICTLEKPYRGFGTKESFIEGVVNRKQRPSLSSIPSSSLRQLIKECWDPNPELRPTMSHVVKVLRIETSLTGGLGSSTSSIGPGPAKTSMKLVDASFGISSQSTLKKINSWTQKRMPSASSLKSTLTLSRSSVRSLFSTGRTDDTVATDRTDEMESVPLEIAVSSSAQLGEEVQEDNMFIGKEELSALADNVSEMFPPPNSRDTAQARKTIPMGESCPEIEFGQESLSALADEESDMFPTPSAVVSKLRKRNSITRRTSLESAQRVLASSCPELDDFQSLEEEEEEEAQ